MTVASESDGGGVEDDDLSDCELSRVLEEEIEVARVEEFEKGLKELMDATADVTDEYDIEDRKNMILNIYGNRAEASWLAGCSIVLLLPQARRA